MADRNTSISRRQLEPIIWDDLEATNIPLDEYVASYDDATKKFTWIPVVTESEWNQNGFENTTDSTLTWTDSTPDRTLSIQPSATGSSFNYWIAGVKYTSFGDTVQITDVEGVHYIYYDGDTLTFTANPSFLNRISILETKAFVSVIYWNATDKEAIYIGEERHGKSMSPLTHSYLHFTQGLQYVEGLGLNTLSVDQDGADNEDAQFGIDSGSVADEDLFSAISSIASATGFPIYYMTGATPIWNKILNAGYSVTKTGATGEDRLAYNQYTGGSWQLTEVPDTYFVLCHIFATTEKDKPMIAIVGQNIYDKKPKAQTGAKTEIQELILNNILFPEIRPIATVIFEIRDTYNNTMKARVVSTKEKDDYVDWRNEVISRTSISTTDHNALTGLQGGAVGEYYHLTSADYTELNQWLDNVILGSDGKLTLPLGVAINEFSLDGTLAGDSDLAVPTEKAVKTYVDGLDLDDISDGSIYKRLKVDNFTIKENSNIIKVADRIELNTMLLAFKMSVNEGESKFDMINGFMDEYEDETGIDTETGQSTGQTYDSTNNLYKPTPGATLEVDYCEYATDELAQINWETSLAGGLDEDTKLLLHGNGQDGGKEIVDDGNTGHIVTQVADATLQVGTPGKFNQGVYLDGTGDYLSIPDHADFDFGTGNFVIDGWFKADGALGSYNLYQSSASGDNGVYVNTDPAFNVYVTVSHGSGAIVNLTGNGGDWASDWHHIAVVRTDSNVFNLYFDGTRIDTQTNAGTVAHSGAFLIGSSYAPAYYKGWIDEFRVSKGTDRGWTGATITVPTAEHTSDANTKLLLHLNGNFTDSGNTVHTVTANGNATSIAPKFGSSACYFDGTGDYLSIPDSADWDVIASNSDDWTIDLWVKHTDHVGQEGYISHGATTDDLWFLKHVHGTGLAFSSNIGGGAGVNLSGGEITDTDWHHVALIKIADEYGLYLDGVQTAYVQDASVANFTSALNIGRDTFGLSYYFDGHMDEIRIQKSNYFEASPNSGKTDTITIPTSAHTSDSNTKLLLHMNTQDVSGDGGSGLYHIPTFHGNMQLDTAVKKWGSACYKFNGSTDYISLPDSADWDVCADYTEDWTIDLWVKHDDHVGREYYVANTIAPAGSYWGLSNNHGYGLDFEGIGTLTGGEITDTDWHHVAWVKKGGVSDAEYGLYKDGIQVAYLQTSNTLTGQDAFRIGALHMDAVSQFHFAGYMDEIRIQKSNHFSASPNVGKTDTITIPTTEYGDAGLLSYSEDTIKEQGSYSLKVIADATVSLNENVRNTFASSKDLSSYSFLKFYIRASRVGTNLQMRLHDETTGSVILTKDIEIATGEEDTWKTITWDISAETGTNLDQIDYIELKITNADAENTIYLDNIYVGSDPLNMVLISEAYNAEADPDTARIVLFEQDVDEITLGVDLRAYISKDDGASWQEITLSDEGNYDNNIRILSGIGDLTETGIGSATGYPVKYKITTHNQKNLYLHGVGANWD